MIVCDENYFIEKYGLICMYLDVLVVVKVVVLG